jgi:hypothetical protein
MRKQIDKTDLVRIQMALGLIKQSFSNGVINQNDYDMIERVLINCEQKLILKEGK